MVRIEVNYDKCTEPMLCRKCLQVCPLAVFGLEPLENRVEVGREPRKWKLDVVYPELCNGCGGCAKICPVEALTMLDSTSH